MFCWVVYLNHPKFFQQCSNPEKSVILFKVTVHFIWLSVCGDTANTRWYVREHGQRSTNTTKHEQNFKNLPVNVSAWVTSAISKSGCLTRYLTKSSDYIVRFDCFDSETPSGRYYTCVFNWKGARDPTQRWSLELPLFEYEVSCVDLHQHFILFFLHLSAFISIHFSTAEFKMNVPSVCTFNWMRFKGLYDL